MHGIITLQCALYLNAHLFLEVKELLFGEGCDLTVLLVKVTSKGRVVNLEKNNLASERERV